MNGLIITNQVIGHNEYKIKRFIEEFDKMNVSLSVVENNGTIAKIEDNDAKIDLPKHDFIIYLDKDIYLARLLEKNGERLFNKADFIKICDDKILTFIQCANNNISMPKTIAGPLVYTSNLNPKTDFLEKIGKELGFPLIVKKVYGSLGEGIYKIESNEDLHRLYKEICNSPILFQEYIKSNTGRSIRVLVIDGKVFGCFARVNAYDFRSNFGGLASSEKIDNPDKYLAFGQDIANKLDIEYAGIDLLEKTDGSLVLCEINSNAFFEEFEKVTGSNVAKAVAEMIVKKVSYEQELREQK